jgi:hypothetical protein
MIEQTYKDGKRWIVLGHGVLELTLVVAIVNGLGTF